MSLRIIVDVNSIHSENQRNDVLGEVVGMRIQHCETRTIVVSTINFTTKGHSERLFSSSDLFVDTVGNCVSKSIVYSR